MKILTQIIGIAAMAASVYSFQLNKHKHIMIVQIIATALFGMQYYLLGAFTGAMLDAVGVVRDIVFYNKDKKWASGNVWTVVFSLMMVVFGIVTYQGVASIFMIVSMVFNTITFSFTKPKLVRRTILIASPFMLVYNILTGSIGGIINEIFAEISSVVGMFRHDFKKDK